MTPSSPRGSGRLVACIAVALAVGSCAAAPRRPEIVSDRAVLLPVPVVAQDEFYECGLAAVSALCRYHGVEIPAADRRDLVRRAAANHGLTGADLRAELDALGLRTWIFPGTLDREPTGLYRQLDAGRPLLVMLSERGAAHYVLVSGYDPAVGTVHVLDPQRGPVMWPAAVFERMWDDEGHFALLALPALPSAAPSAPSLVDGDLP